MFALFLELLCQFLFFQVEILANTIHNYTPQMNMILFFRIQKLSRRALPTEELSYGIVYKPKQAPRLLSFVTLFQYTKSHS